MAFSIIDIYMAIICHISRMSICGSHPYSCIQIEGYSLDSLLHSLMARSDVRYRLRLFVTGSSARTAGAIANLRTICDEAFPDHYDLVVVDVLTQPAIAEQEKVLATPTLIKESPLPIRRIIGDFSDKEKVLAGMGLAPTSS